MIFASLLFLGHQIASEPVGRITKVHVQYKRAGDGNSATATVTARSIKNRGFKQVFQLATYPGGAANTKPVILDQGLVAIFTRHELSRFNIIVGLTVEHGLITVDEEYNEKLYAMLPTKLKKETIPDNVLIEGTSHGKVNVNFVNRDGHDGVEGIFRVKDLKWTCVSAKYWRDSDWDGIRRF